MVGSRSCEPGFKEVDLLTSSSTPTAEEFYGNDYPDEDEDDEDSDIDEYWGGRRGSESGDEYEEDGADSDNGSW